MRCSCSVESPYGRKGFDGNCVPVRSRDALLVLACIQACSRSASAGATPAGSPDASGQPSPSGAAISGTLQIGARYGCEPAPCEPDPEQEGVSDEIAYTRYNVFAEQYADAVAVIQTLAAPTDFVVTDHPYLTFLAGRLVPPLLVDTSRSRIRSRSLRGAEAIAQATPYDPQLVVLWADRLRGLAQHDDPDIRALALASLHYSRGTVADVRAFLATSLRTLQAQPALDDAVRARWALVLGYLGDRLRAEGNPLAAIATYQKAREIDARNAQILVNLALAQADAGNAAAAIASYQASLAMSPAQPLTLVNLLVTGAIVVARA